MSLVEVRDLAKYFPIHAGLLSRHVADVKAVDGVSFDIDAGETLGLVGESGSGKTTIGRMLLHLLPATKGSIRYDGTEITTMRADDIRRLRRQIQIIFQDPYASLNPRMTIGEIIGEPLRIHHIATGKAALERVQELLRLVGLRPYSANRYPHEFWEGNASASASRARSRLTPSSSSATSRFPRSTSRFKRRSSICWRICSANLA